MLAVSFVSDKQLRPCRTISASHGVLYSHQRRGPGEIRRREVVLDPQVSSEKIRSREVEMGLKVGVLLLQLLPNGGATDTVTVPHSSWDSG